jgi:hypothetical protein
MIQKPKRHGVILPRLIESNLVNQPLTIQDSALPSPSGQNPKSLSGEQLGPELWVDAGS